MQINAICKNEESWYTTMTIRGIPIEFKLGSGADANVLPLEQIRKLPGDVIFKPTETMLWHMEVQVVLCYGSLSLCLDPRELNRRQHYSIPTPEDVQSKLFTILDEKDEYWQIKLDKASSLLCTSNTPRFRFKHPPFGLKSSSEVFQQKNSEAFGDISGVHVIADDMIIAAVDEKEHTESDGQSQRTEHQVQREQNTVQSHKSEIHGPHNKSRGRSTGQ